MLHPGGLGPVDFGTPADEAVKTFTELFGQPDIEDSDEFSARRSSKTARHGPRQPDPRVRVPPGMTIIFTDWDASTSDPAPHHFASWHMGERAVAVDEPLVTAEGIGIGSTAVDVRVGYPRRDPDAPERVELGFEVRSREGSISGSFVGPVRPSHYKLQPDFVMAIQ